MQNAHLRLARLEYVRSSAKTQTNISVHVSHYIGEKEQAHLLSFFGNDAEVGAITAAIQDNHRFDLHTLDGTKRRIGLGPEASTYKANLTVASQKRSIRHVVAVSSWLHANGSAGRTFLLNGDPESDVASWAALVSLQGIPAEPSWASHMMQQLRRDDKVKSLQGVGCAPVVVEATRQELMDGLGRARKAGLIPFPEKNGPVHWPSHQLNAALSVTA